MSSKSSAASKVALSLPKAKTTNIVIQELENEMLVYDLENDKAHHLNETVSFVWKCCDGKTSTNEIAAQLSDRIGTSIDEDFVGLALDELANASLLAEKAGDELVDLTRRRILFKYAPMAAALPVVMSLVAPPAALAQSCIAPNQPCNPPGSPIGCCSGFCEGSPGTCQIL